MFSFGAFEAANQPALVATLQKWVTLPGVRIETVPVPGMDGSFYASGALGEAAWIFDCNITTPTPAETLGVAGELAAACSPNKGLQPLAIDAAPGWLWYAVVDTQISWERGIWAPGAACTLKGQLSFRCPDPYGYAFPDEVTNGSGGQLSITRTKGNLPSYPKFEIWGEFETATLTVGDLTVDVATPCSTGQKLVLNYKDMDFALYNSTGVKLAHAAKTMSTLTRIELPPDTTTQITTTATGGQITMVAVEANSRRA